MIPGRTWHSKGSGFAPEVGYTYKGQVRGVVDCAGVCSKLGSTKSYFYNDDTRECQYHNCKYTEAEFSNQSVPNSQYYEEVTEESEVQQDIDVIYPATMAEPPCPSNASVATGVIKSGCSLFRVRAFLDTVRSYDDAQAVCEANGGILYKATTLEKFNLARQLITNCHAYMSTDYFINGKDYTGTREYNTTDGELIQMPADVWAPGRPNNGGITCLWMAARFEYRWDDHTCDINLSYPTHAFCEIPQ